MRRAAQCGERLVSRISSPPLSAVRGTVSYRRLYEAILLPHRNMLPKFLQLLIDAHRSDVPWVSLNLFTPFTRSIHQLSCHYATPLLHSALQHAEVPPAETLRMTAYQPTEQLRGCGVRLALKPAKYLAPHSLERVRTRPPRASHEPRLVSTGRAACRGTARDSRRSMRSPGWSS